MDDHTTSVDAHARGDLKATIDPRVINMSASDLAEAKAYLGLNLDGAAADSCDVTYKFLDDFFEIRGKFWAMDPIGNDGAGLLKQLQGCAGATAVTSWSFQLTPDDTTYDWYANGDIIVGQRSCVGNAVEAAGGPSKGNCVGAG